MMDWKRTCHGGVLATIGFLLSPLSWWNDMVINIPLALLFAWTVSFFYRPAFETSLIVGYWLTNIIGFVLLHKGVQQMVGGEKKPYRGRALWRDVLISLLYTALIIVLVKLHVFSPVTDYFQKHAA